jgi:hypothetical protein
MTPTVESEMGFFLSLSSTRYVQRHCHGFCALACFIPFIKFLIYFPAGDNADALGMVVFSQAPVVDQLRSTPTALTHFSKECIIQSSPFALPPLTFIFIFS